MDLGVVFIKEVLEVYQVDNMLTPVNLGDGELENILLSDLRKELDFCLLDISSYTLKEKLLDYIEDYLLDLRMIKIPSKKNLIKTIKKSIKKLNKQHPILDINIEHDEIVIEEINKYKWLLTQEKYILAYLKEQQFFIRLWVSEARKELADNPLKEWVEKERSKLETRKLMDKIRQKKQNVVIPKKHHFYCQVGELFAQNYIYRKPSDDNFSFIYFYQDQDFINVSQLSKYIRKDVLKTKHSVSQYIGDTLNNNDTSHNFYNNKTKLASILEYCKEKGIKIINEKFILDRSF